MSTNTEVGMVQGELVQGGELRLQDLAERINEEHDNCERSLRQGLQHALNAGGLLIEARSLCPHGAWATWLEDNTTVSQRTAQLYMRVARGLPVLEAKAQHVADLSLREAVALLAEPAPDLSAKGEEHAAAQSELSGPLLVSRAWHYLGTCDFIELSPTSLRFKRDPTYEEWAKLGRILGIVAQSTTERR